MTSPKAWSLLAVEGVRQYGGNTGYEDDPSAIYRYDSDVANHRNVGSGDVAVIRSGTTVLGIGTIEAIVEGQGSKVRQRCPECGTVNIKARTTQLPRWRCTNAHFFERAAEETVQVATFEAHYGKTFKACPSEVTLGVLNDAVIRPNDQMSIKEIDLARLEPILLPHPEVAPIVRNHVRRLAPEEIGTEGNGSANSIIEERRRVLREISLRRGQARFRKRLIDRYGARCQISGCEFPGLVEAAHVSPYARSSDNSETNGLLLRSDLHTLFDLGLLGIDPVTLEVAIHQDAKLAGYDLFDGRKLSVNATSGPGRAALKERWAFYSDRLTLQDTDQ
ncbi:MAG: hypothetical protein C0494_16820 [Sphingobium sp.]|nr:hypothetical protein [Sphingobium sp.]